MTQTTQTNDAAVAKVVRQVLYGLLTEAEAIDLLVRRGMDRVVAEAAIRG